MPLPTSPPPTGLQDAWGRVHTSLRISVTDRCNIRCFYCMPDETIQFKPRSQILTFEEITRFVESVVPLGIDRVRITGGEPLVRAELPRLVARLAALPGIRDLALTTNGILLGEQADALRQAGLHRVNISLDALSEATFQQITRRPGLDRVLAGIAAARRAGFAPIRLNAVAIRGLTEPEIVPLVQFASAAGLQLRFIEFMPLDADQQWHQDHVLSSAAIRQRIEAEFGPLRACPRRDPSQPAIDFELADRQGSIGFISPVTAPFCHDCNRLRLTAEGQVRNCLFSTEEWDARHLLRSGASADALRALVRDCVEHKKPGHGIDSPTFQRPARAMYQIGG